MPRCLIGPPGISQDRRQPLGHLLLLLAILPGLAFRHLASVAMLAVWVVTFPAVAGEIDVRVCRQVDGAAGVIDPAETPVTLPCVAVFLQEGVGWHGHGLTRTVILLEAAFAVPTPTKARCDEIGVGGNGDFLAHVAFSAKTMYA